MIPRFLTIPFLIGTLFTLAFVGSWAAFFWVDRNQERAIVCTLLEVFAGPLLAGAILTLLGRRSGLYLLRVGSVLLIVHPDLVLALWTLEFDREYIGFMAKQTRHERTGRVTRRSRRPGMAEHSPDPGRDVGD